MKKYIIENIIKEALGVSQQAVDHIERIKREVKSEWGSKTLIGDVERNVWINFGMYNFDGYLYSLSLIFHDRPDGYDYDNYPILQGSVTVQMIPFTNEYGAEIDIVFDSEICEDDKYKNLRISRLLDDPKFNQVLIHEMHHPITNSKREKDRGFKFFRPPNRATLTDLLKTKKNTPLSHLYYRLGKNEMNSTVPEYKIDPKSDSLNLFRKFKAMDYETFVNAVKKYDGGRVPPEREYRKIQDRLKLLFNKLRKLGVSE